jgi:hypothetical protein
VSGQPTSLSATLLDASGKDYDEGRLVEMLRHWLSQNSIAQCIRSEVNGGRLKPPIVRAESEQLYTSGLSKLVCARILRDILLSKKVRLAVAQVIHSQMVAAGAPPTPLNALRGDLKSLASEMKVYAEAGKAGITLHTKIEPVKPTLLEDYTKTRAATVRIR